MAEQPWAPQHQVVTLWGGLIRGALRCEAHELATAVRALNPEIREGRGRLWEQ